MLVVARVKLPGASLLGWLVLYYCLFIAHWYLVFHIACWLSVSYCINMLVVAGVELPEAALPAGRVILIQKI